MTGNPYILYWYSSHKIRFGVFITTNSLLFFIYKKISIKNYIINLMIIFLIKYDFSTFRSGFYSITNMCIKVNWMQLHRKICNHLFFNKIVYQNRLIGLFSGTDLKFSVSFSTSEDDVHPYSHSLWGGRHEVVMSFVGFHDERELWVGGFDAVEVIQVHFFDSLKQKE